jgi:hypothetical protein
MTAVEPERPPREDPSPAPAGRASIEDASLEHLQARIGALEAQVRGAVERRRAVDPQPGDPFRGLYVSDQQAAALLDDDPSGAQPTAEDWIRRVEIEAWAEEVDPAGSALRLRRLAGAFGLEDADVALLLAALVPDVDPRFERLFGYLQDDVTRRRASVGLALQLAGLRMDDAEARRRLTPAGRRVAPGLVVIEDRE